MLVPPGPGGVEYHSGVSTWCTHPARGRAAIRRKKIERNAPIYKQIEEIIEADITKGALRAGDRVPSERELCERYGVSVTPVRRALQRLVMRGLVLRRRGSGSYVAEPARSDGPVNLIFHKWVELETDPVYGELLAGIVDGAGARGRSILVRHVREENPSPAETAKLAEAVGRSRAGGVLLMGSPDRSVLAALAEVAPTVQVGHRLTDPGLNYVGADVAGAVSAGCEAMLAAGASRLAFFDGHGTGDDGRPAEEISAQTLDAYVDWCASRGFEPLRLAPAADMMRAAAEARSRGGMLGVFAHESGSGLKLMEAAGEAGLQPGEDLFLVAFDNGGRGEKTKPRMSAVKTFSREMGARAVEALEEVASGRAVREILPPELVRRETCGEGVGAGVRR
jgi:DNA-binding LacI/PurR family transcriptional regulator